MKEGEGKVRQTQSCEEAVIKKGWIYSSEELYRLTRMERGVGGGERKVK